MINVVDLEDYVKGVVPYEMDKDWPLAALEAQAVCARTYAAKTRHPSLGFDVCAGTDCQVYYGRNRATDLTDEAVDNTAGEMIYYDGKPADTLVYCASNGGATEDAANVWNSDIPYLVGKKDPYEAKTAIPNYSWSVTYTAEELTWILEQKGYNIGKVENVYVSEFTPMGNVGKVTFEGSRGQRDGERGDLPHRCSIPALITSPSRASVLPSTGPAQLPAAFTSMTAGQCIASLERSQRPQR